jgi:hypothetical protein
MVGGPESIARPVAHAQMKLDQVEEAGHAVASVKQGLLHAAGQLRGGFVFKHAASYGAG